MEDIRKHINFRTEEYFLKELAYSDNVYAWLLLHSNFNRDEKHDFIYKSEINFKDISLAIHRSRQTVSKRFNYLLENHIIVECIYKGKKCYKIPYYREFEELDGETTFQLLRLPLDKQREEIIKVYAILLKYKRDNQNQDFLYSYSRLIQDCGWTPTNKETFLRMKTILTILQGAGIVKFRVIMEHREKNGNWIGPQMEIYEVNKRASEEWLGIKPEN